MPSVMPVATAASRASFEPKSISVVTVVTPPSSVKDTVTIASFPGYPPPTVPGSYASVWTSFDVGCTSRNVPAKPNSLPSWSLRRFPRHLWL
jgi:hypothetical protein